MTGAVTWKLHLLSSVADLSMARSPHPAERRLAWPLRFAIRHVLSREWKSDGVTNDERGEWIEKDEVTAVRMKRTIREQRLVRGGQSSLCTCPGLQRHIIPSYEKCNHSTVLQHCYLEQYKDSNDEASPVG